MKKHILLVRSPDDLSQGSSLDIIKDSRFSITTVISGGARGVDSLGERFAKENNIPLTILEAQWDLLGKSAGYIRNEAMAEQADALIAICVNSSRGTTHMVNIARRKKLKIHVKYLE